MIAAVPLPAAKGCPIASGGETSAQAINEHNSLTL
jgi:hypothetical protein